MIWVAGRSPTLVSQNLKATTLTYLAIGLTQLVGGYGWEASYQLTPAGNR